MEGNVLPLARLTDAARLHVAATVVRNAARETDEVLAADLADLLDAIARAVETRSHPPLGEVESWRWSATYGVARRIARAWAP